MIINYPTNISAFGNISAKYERGENALWVWMDDKPIYLFYDSVYLIKNVPNNVLAWKQFLFPPFICKELRRNNDAMVAGGQISGILSTVSTTSILNAKLIFGPLQNWLRLQSTLETANRVFQWYWPCLTQQPKLQSCNIFQVLKRLQIYFSIIYTWRAISNSKEGSKATTGLVMLQFWVTARMATEVARGYLIVRNSLYQLRHARL